MHGLSFLPFSASFFFLNSSNLSKIKEGDSVFLPPPLFFYVKKQAFVFCRGFGFYFGFFFPLVFFLSFFLEGGMDSTCVSVGVCPMSMWHTLYHIKTSMAKFCGKATQVPHVESPSPEGPRCIQQDSMFSFSVEPPTSQGLTQLSVWMVVTAPPVASLPSILYFGGLLSCYKNFLLSETSTPPLFPFSLL